MRKPSSRRVAIIYPADAPWVVPCLGGVRHYARCHGDWHLFTSRPTFSGGEASAHALRSMMGWKGDGVIAATNDESELRCLREMGIPAVNLTGGLSQSCGVPRVMANNRHGGRLAAEHLLSRGLRHLAYFGWQNVWYSEQRHLGFAERAAEAGLECACFLRPFRDPSGQNWLEQITRVGAWLASLPRPAGIFAVSDNRAQLLLEACQEADLRIPDEVAVIGMDNDELICEHCVPTLTSVSRNSERVGWEAAALLDRMMQGEPVPTADLLLEPDGVVARRSTDRLYCADPVAQRALDFMRANLPTQFNVEQVAEHAGVSKRTLETRFRECLQCSPHEFLTRLRVQRARTLMGMSQRRTMEQLALECGFGTVRAFYTTVRRVTGRSPASFRREHAAPTNPVVRQAIGPPGK